jgi:opacity protein-like surface antigen
LGEATFSDSINSGTINARGLEFSAVGKTPSFKGLVGFAKVGVAFIKGEITASTGSLSGSERKQTGKPVVGLGLLYNLGNNISLRVEYERRDVKVSNIAGTTATVSNVSFGLQGSY